MKYECVNRNYIYVEEKKKERISEADASATF